MRQAYSCPHCGSSWVVRKGFSRQVQCLQKGKGRRQRFLCRACQRSFSEHTHLIFWGLKKPDPALNAKIFRLSIVNGVSNRGIGRELYISEHCVRMRLERMARRGFVFQDESTQEVKISEPICMDGLENFAISQYDVNNLQQALGKESTFIYDFNFASMNRKGRTSKWQKKRLYEIEKFEGGRYNPKNIRLAVKDLTLRLFKKRKRPEDFLYFTDQHFLYGEAIHADLRHLKIHHRTISSKSCRNFQNLIFPVNHADLLIRQQVKAFARETISFSKTHAAMCQKYVLFMIYKNFMAPQFTKKHVRRPKAHTHSPAQLLGITDRLLEFSDIFDRRSTAKDLLQLNEDWQHFWRGEIPSKYQRHSKFIRQTTA